MSEIYTDKYRFALIAQKAEQLQKLTQGLGYPIGCQAALDIIKRAAIVELARLNESEAAK